jgi:hypothetical protein
MDQKRREHLKQLLREQYELLAECEDKITGILERPHASYEKGEIEKKISELKKQLGEDISPSSQTEPINSSGKVEVVKTASPVSGGVEIFFSYSSNDENLRDKLVTHLGQLKSEGRIREWYNRQISPGIDWDKEINEHLNSAKIILLLISPDFQSSGYIRGVELKRAMERYEAGEARVIPVILRPADWETAIFGKLQALPKNAKPVSTWKSRDEAFLDIVKGIRKVVDELLANPQVAHRL